jgi:hypothetical protein
VTHDHDGKAHAAVLSLQRDLEQLGESIAAIGGISLIVVDPLNAYFGDQVDTHKTAAVRSVLAQLDGFANKNDIAILGIMHPPKTVAVGPVSVPVSVIQAGAVSGDLRSTKQGTATGERGEKVPATGVVTFYNWNSVAVEVPQGTHVSVSGTIAFVTIQRIVVSRGKFNGPPGSKSVQVAARGTLDVSNHIVQITSTSSETGRMASDARDSAVDLSQQAETLKREVDGFIMSVRAG